MDRTTARRPGPPKQLTVAQMRKGVDALLLAGAEFLSPSKMDDLMRTLMAKAADGPVEESKAFADAMLMAMDLALFTPSASGQTAFDRLARQRTGLAAEETAALPVLRQATFRVLELVRGGGTDCELRDLASGEVLTLAGFEMEAGLVGLKLAGRLVPVGEGIYLPVSIPTPLDDAAFAVAAGFIRPGRGLLSQHRCAEAVYRHVMRHGTLRIAGLNDPDGLDSDGLPGGADGLDHIAQLWAVPGAARLEEDVQAVRADCSLDTVIYTILSVVHTRAASEHALASAYRDILQIQLETLHRRQAIGSAVMGLDAVAAEIAAEVKAGALDARAREVFEEVRRRFGAAPPGAAAGRGDADLDRLIARIQALRAKTVEQGCTEAEAMAAAEKVAELLDRYGLSLSEMDLKQQACEGAAVETGRKRLAPVDECVPGIGLFFDCRVWSEKGADGALRYIFFGLPADVAGARYLYDLVEQAFETETAAFRAGPTYQALQGGMRRTALNSFGIGMSRGIAAKLYALRQSREGALRRSSGRDLVVAKAEVVDAEMARLGLNLTARKEPKGRRILRGAFEEGHEAGLGFQYTPGVTDDR